MNIFRNNHNNPKDDMIYMGFWNPVTNVPELKDGTGEKNQWYIISMDREVFSRSLGNGEVLWKEINSVYCDGDKWLPYPNNTIEYEIDKILQNAKMEILKLIGK